MKTCNFRQRDLISADYLAEQKALHAGGNYGVSGGRFAPLVDSLVGTGVVRDVLDYGCGLGYLRRNCISPIKEYDPAVRNKNDLPAPADLVVCADVLEHIEPEKIAAVLAHIESVTRRFLLAAIALRPSQKNLSDGRNAHILMLTPTKWRAALKRAGFRGVFWHDHKHEMIGLLRK